MTVHLVGAGPGDPGLITARGLELVRGCEALVHDVLVAGELVQEAPAGALIVSRAGLRQEEINDLLVSLGRDGVETVRLKGGDPFVFGRGGEEAIALAAASVPYEVVPGVSAASSVAAAAGIPVTHRGVSARVTLLSGHSAGGAELDFPHLARTPGTLVFFMGLERLGALAGGLVEAGKAASTPAAVVSGGTTAAQGVACGRLDEIDRLAGELEPPALVVVGDVVALRERLAATALAAVGCAG